MQLYWSANRTFITILILGCFAGLAAETPKESSCGSGLQPAGRKILFSETGISNSDQLYIRTG